MMKFFRLRGLLCILMVLALAPFSGFAEEIRVEDKGLDFSDEVSIRYPAVTGMEDTDLQDRINDRILEDCRIRDYLARAALLLSGGILQVEWTGGILGDVFSCAVSAAGAVESSRPTNVWTASAIDLRDGQEITFDDLFTEGEAARELIEAYLENEVMPDLSAHLLSSELFPLPAAFLLDDAGLTLLYPVEQLSTLRDRAGDIRISWHVLRPVLNLSEDSIPSRIGVTDSVTLSEKSGKRLLETAAEGCLPGIPAKLDDSLWELTERYHLLTDPDGYEGGRLFSLEGGCFGGVYLLTDDLSAGWEESRVEGIRIDKGGLGCLFIGDSIRTDWLSVLGEPDHTASIDADKAEANRLVPGTCDYYDCGEYQLQLYSNEDEILFSAVLTE